MLRINYLQNYKADKFVHQGLNQKKINLWQTIAIKKQFRSTCMKIMKGQKY